MYMLFILIILLLIMSILFGIYYSKYKSCEKEKTSSKSQFLRSLEPQTGLIRTVLPDKNKTPVYVCDPKNIPSKWPFTDYDFDGIAITTRRLEITSSRGDSSDAISWSIRRYGDQLLWIAGFAPNIHVLISFNDLVFSSYADDNGFVYVTNNVPLPICALPYNEIRVTVYEVLDDNGRLKLPKTITQKMSYNVSTNSELESWNDCIPKNAIWGVFAILSEENKNKICYNINKKIGGEPITVTFPVVINVFPEIDGKIVQKYEYSTRSGLIKNGELGLPLVYNN